MVDLAAIFAGNKIAGFVELKDMCHVKYQHSLLVLPTIQQPLQPLINHPQIDAVEKSQC